MVDQAIFWLKGGLLTEALTHAARSWGIFDGVRSSIALRSVFFSRLIACFECTSIWIAAGVFTYLYLLDFRPITFIIITARLATFAHIVIDLVDASRAATINKI